MATTDLFVLLRGKDAVMARDCLSPWVFLGSSEAFGPGAALGRGISAGYGPMTAVAGEVLPDIEKPGRTANAKVTVHLELWLRGPLEQRIREAAELGFPSVEFWP